MGSYLYVQMYYTIIRGGARLRTVTFIQTIILLIFCLVISPEYPYATFCPGYFPCCNNNRKSDTESWRWMVFPKLERPCNDLRGYDPLFVDAFGKAVWGSSISHSYSPSCKVRIVGLDN